MQKELLLSPCLMKSIRALAKTEPFVLVLLAIVALRPSLDVLRDTVFSVGSRSLNMTTLVGLVTLLLATGVAWHFRKSIALTQAHYTLVAFAAWCLCTVLFAHAPILGLTEWVKLITVAVLFVAVSAASSKNENVAPTLLLLLSLGLVVPLVVSAGQWLSGTGLTIDGIGNRIYGTLAHPNILAIVLLVGMLALARLRETETLSGNDYFFAWLLVGAAIFATLTRVAWVVVVLAILYNLFNKNKKIFLATLGLLACLYTALFLLAPTIEKNIPGSMVASVFERIHAAPGQLSSVYWRYLVVADAGKLVANHPVTGYGYGLFEPTYRALRDPSRQTDLSSEAHDDYLRVVVETGVPGLLLYLLFLATLLKNSYYAIKKNSSHLFFLSVAGFILFSATENMLHHTAPLWWIFSLWGIWQTKENANTP